MAGIGSFKDSFNNGRMEIYTGAQPVTADAAVTGTLLCTITANGAAFTPEVLATGSVTLSTGAAGSVNTVTVNGVDILGAAIPFNTTLTQTATDVANQINEFHTATEYIASASGTVITLTSVRGTGVATNGFVVACTSTTITTAVVNMAGGVAPVNGLRYGAPTAGGISKSVAQVWSGVAVAAGSAGWYRLYGSTADTGALDATGTVIREDGAILVGAGELPMSSTVTAVGVPIVIATRTYSLPTL
jgi:hypothetical protein